MNRYDCITFTNHDSDVAMIQTDLGDYVKYDDYKAKIELAIEGFKNLKHCRIGENSATELNEYVTNMIENLK